MKNIARRHPCTALVLALALASAASAAPASRTGRPNVILFVVDDLGWKDTAVYGSEYYETPSIDRLAGSGMLFTDAYAASPVCSPTRASILTGRHPARLGITDAAGTRPPLRADAPRFEPSADARYKTIWPRSLRFLSQSELTLAEVLRLHGYATAHIGKWHLGRLPGLWPDQQGFQKVTHGSPDAGPRSYFAPYGFLQGNLRDAPPGEFLTDRLTDEALDFIETNRERPFFVNLWHYAVHGPWDHKQEITDRFAGRVDPRGKQGNPIMASMIRSVDDSLGRILDKLEELGLRQDTVVILTSDNGGNEGGKTGPKQLPATSNDPLRGAKGWLYEGGVRVPLIVSWPRQVAAGSRSDEAASSVDIFPTVLDMLDRELPPNARTLQLDGESLLPVLRQERGLRRQGVFFFYPHGGGLKPPGVAVRSGQWKMIRWFETNRVFDEERELYDVRQDLGERVNLVDREPAVVARLDSLIDAFLDRTGALLPKENPAYDPRRAQLAGLQVFGRLIEIADGRLTTAIKSSEQFLRAEVRREADVWLPRDDYRGALTFAMRLRSERAGSGRVQWLHSGRAQDFRRQVAEFTVPVAGEWVEIELRLEPGPDQGLSEFEIHLPPDAGVVDFDWIRIHGASGEAAGQRALWDWEFDPVSDRPSPAG